MSKFTEELASTPSGEQQDSTSETTPPIWEDVIDPVLLDNQSNNASDSINNDQGTPEDDIDDETEARPWKYKASKFWNYVDDELDKTRKFICERYKTQVEREEAMTEYETFNPRSNTPLMNSQVLHTMLPARSVEVSRNAREKRVGIYRGLANNPSQRTRMVTNIPPSSLASLPFHFAATFDSHLSYWIRDAYHLYIFYLYLEYSCRAPPLILLCEGSPLPEINIVRASKSPCIIILFMLVTQSP